MIDLGISKIALIGAVALIVIGPEKLPRVARTVGTLLGKAQRYVADVKNEVNRSMELDEFKKMKDTVEGAARYIDASAESVSVAKGLGARHWAAAAITRRTKSVAVAVSETNGTVRIFQNGDVVLRIEPFRRAMKWKEFEYEPPSTTD